MNNSTKLPIVGIIGDGQLAMMMAEAYSKLGGQTFVFGESNDGPASGVADRVFVGSPSSVEDLTGFFRSVDVVTLENEFNDSSVLNQAAINSKTQLRPNPERFGLIEDKLSEKRFFQKIGVTLADFFEVKNEDDLVDELGYLKLAKGGYDGIGTYRVDNIKESKALFEKIRSSGTVLFEHAVDFAKELSLIAVSNTQEVVFYPLVETHQEHGTCRYVNYPAGVSQEIEQQAQTQVAAILKELDTHGLFAFEFFLSKSGELILNESAPRPHNSGHITLDLNDCSQFENHMRAIADLELITPKQLHDSMTMINLLGTRDGIFDEQVIFGAVDDKEAGITLYRKHESRVKRKMGHINISVSYTHLTLPTILLV